MDRFHIKREGNGRYLIVDKISRANPGFIYDTGYSIAEAYDLDKAQLITNALNEKERRENPGSSKHKEVRPAMVPKDAKPEK